MGDIAKEFNMVDFIGMLIPGFLVTMLFSYEFGGWAALAHKDYHFHHLRICGRYAFS